MHNLIGDTVSLFSRSVSAVVVILCGMKVHTVPWWWATAAHLMSEEGRAVVEVMSSSCISRVQSTLFQDIDKDVST